VVQIDLTFGHLARRSGDNLPRSVSICTHLTGKPAGLSPADLAGIGTTVVEAAALGRRAPGVEVEPRWAEAARANVDHVLDPGHAALAEIRVGDARRLGDVLGDLAGTVDLVCTSPPYACDVGNMDKANWGAGGDLCPSDERNYSTDKSNLGPAALPTTQPWSTSAPAASPCSGPAGCSSR
jgi:hypothetical protein